MLLKGMKIGAAVAAGVVVVGGFLFGGELISYMRTSANAVQDAVKDSVPIDFELRRARTMLDELIPEMHANIQLIAQEEVEAAALAESIEDAQVRLNQERLKIARLRDLLRQEQMEYQIGGRVYDRQHLAEELERRLDLYREAETVLRSKERLMEARQNSLQAAQAALTRARSQKHLLADRIESLESQHRMILAQAQGSKLSIDSSKIGETERLLDQIKKRLDVAERVMSHEARFVEKMPLEVIDEADLLKEADAVLGEAPQESAAAVEEALEGI